MIEPMTGHLALFNQQLQKENRSVEWVYDDMTVGKALKGDHADSASYRDMDLPADVVVQGTKTTPVWYVKVLVDGELYGKGRGSTKKAARNEAAKEGLEKLGIKVW
jgi:ribonuclease-3